MTANGKTYTGAIAVRRDPLIGRLGDGSQLCENSGHFR